MRLGAKTPITNHEPMKHTDRVVERFKQISYGQSEASVAEALRPRKRGAPTELSDSAYSQNSRRQHPERPCNTIVSSSHTNFIHPYLHRNFTVREIARIQSFPDRFQFLGKRAVLSKSLSIKKGYLDDIYLDQRMQIGNAVPPILAEHLAEAIMETLRNGTKSISKTSTKSTRPVRGSRGVVAWT
jgi:DNA (cytosine-5)-methyltransferase 1